jgi:hypothetical protein
MEGYRLRPTEVRSVATFITREPVSDSVRRLVALTSKAQTLLELDEIRQHSGHGLRECCGVRRVQLNHAEQPGRPRRPGQRRRVWRLSG